MLNPDKKKFILFLPGLGNGGAERVILRLFNHLSSQGHEVKLLVASRKGRLVDNVNIDIVYLDSKYSLLSILKYIKYINIFKPDIILSTLSSAIIISGLASLITRKKEEFNAPINLWVANWPDKIKDELINNLSPEITRIIKPAIIEKWLNNESLRSKAGPSIYALFVLNKWIRSNA